MCQIIKNYKNEYKSEHSIELGKYFSISNRGVDYYNDFNISFEFKESFAIDLKNIWFRCKKKQLINSDFFIFIIHSNYCLNHEIHIIDSKFILDSYKFNTYNNRANLRIQTIRNISIYETNNLESLKEYITKIDYK